jgi:hypothetical protein
MIKEEGQELYGCDGDVELASLLAHLFTDPEVSEVEIQHPVDGSQVLTRDHYDELCKALADKREMSPAMRVQNNALERRKNIKDVDRLKRDITGAAIHTVDVVNDSADTFGQDIDGVVLDIDGMMFFQASKYPPGIDIKELELGCFMDAERKRPTIRVCANAEIELPDLTGVEDE